MKFNYVYKNVIYLLHKNRIILKEMYEFTGCLLLIHDAYVIRIKENLHEMHEKKLYMSIIFYCNKNLF